MTNQTTAELIEEARGHAEDAEAGRTTGNASLYRALADALEAAEKERDEARKAAEDHVLDADAVHVRLSAELRAAEKRWKDRAEFHADQEALLRDDIGNLEAERNQYAAIVEKARLIVDRVPDGFWVDEVYELDNILNSVTAPADALRELKAEAWQEGAYRVYNSTLDEAEWWWSDWASENPYKAREEKR